MTDDAGRSFGHGDLEGRSVGGRRFVRSVFQAIPDPFYAFDLDGYLLLWNEEFERVSGYPSEELAEMHMTEFVPEEEVPSIVENFRRVLEGDGTVTIETVVLTNDGERIPYELTGSTFEDADGNVRGMTGVGRDITERDQRERQLQALNASMRSLLEAESKAEAAEIGVEAVRDILGLEANAIHLYDEDADALVPVAMTDEVVDLVGELPTFTGGDSIAWQIYEQGEPAVVDDVRENPDRYNPETSIRSEFQIPLGEHGILIIGSATPRAFDGQDRTLGELLAANVTTAFDQIERERRLRARERELTRQNERLEEFASVVSHDLRNPLGVARGRIELAQEEFDSEHLDVAQNAHRRMETLIDDVLTLAREGVSTTDPGPVALAEVVEACWRTVDTGGATLVTEATRTIRADESRLKQLIENLLRNALEHAGDDVTIRIGDLETGFYVADDGPGIPDSERETVFDAGYSTSAKGTGFGLNIVEQIVDAHGWEITVTEGTQGGARFEITNVDVCDQ